MALPLILVSNDDGISSPGLRAAVESVEKLGEVIIVAPSSQQTSMGRSLWGDENEYLHEIQFKAHNKKITAYHCDCSPARIILHAIDVLFTDKKPDLIVSGINYGENLGSNITLSGTIGAALQGASMGIPALAVSLQTEIKFHHNHGELDWDAAKYFTTLLVERILNSQLPDDVDILNVNIPSSATSKTPWKMTRLSKQPYFTNRIESPHIKSKVGDGKCVIAAERTSHNPDTDIYVILEEQIVSVTPLSLDMTSRIDLSDLRKNWKR